MPRSNTRNIVQGLVWLINAAAFGHLAISSNPVAAGDLRAVFAMGSAVSILLAGVALSGRGQNARLIWGFAAIASALIAVDSLALRVAHETGVVLLFGGVLTFALAVAPPPTSGRSSPAAGGHGS